MSESDKWQIERLTLEDPARLVVTAIDCRLMIALDFLLSLLLGESGSIEGKGGRSGERP